MAPTWLLSLYLWVTWVVLIVYIRRLRLRTRCRMLLGRRVYALVVGQGSPSRRAVLCPVCVRIGSCLSSENRRYVTKLVEGIRQAEATGLGLKCRRDIAIELDPPELHLKHFRVNRLAPLLTTATLDPPVLIALLSLRLQNSVRAVAAGILIGLGINDRRAMLLMTFIAN